MNIFWIANLFSIFPQLLASSMKWVHSIILITLSHSAFAQISDNVAGALKALISTREVASKIFFEYSEGGEKPWALPPGKYAFIAPDTTFQKVYNGILDEFPYSVVTDGYVYKRIFFVDTSGSAYINCAINFELLVVFEKISV